MFFFTLFTNAQVTSIEITPSAPKTGDVISITLQSIPNDKVDVAVSYYTVLTPINDEFTFTLESFEISQNLENLQIEAENVELLRVAVIINGIPVTQTIQGEDGFAKALQDLISPDIYWMQVSGVSTVGSEHVFVNVSAQSSILTDVRGKYITKYDTTGFPPGEIFVKADTYKRKILLQNDKPPLPIPCNIMIELHSIPETFQLNNEYELSYNINNQGDNITGLLVQFMVDNETTLQEEIQGLQGNHTQIYTVKWIPTQSGTHLLQVIVDPNNEIHETNEGDNISKHVVNVEETRNISIILIVAVPLVLVAAYLVFWRNNRQNVHL